MSKVLPLCRQSFAGLGKDGQIVTAAAFFLEAASLSRMACDSGYVYRLFLNEPSPQSRALLLADCFLKQAVEYPSSRGDHLLSQVRHIQQLLHTPKSRGLVPTSRSKSGISNIRSFQTTVSA